MRRTRIRYKKLIAFVLVLAAAAGAIVYGAASLFFSSGKDSGPAHGDDPAYYLLIGAADSAAPQADSVLLLSVAQASREVYVISLPGNTKISRPSEPVLLLRDAYTGEGGAEQMVSAVENLLHIRIGHYAVWDESTFSSFMTRFGGVDLYVEKDMVHHDGEGNQDIGIRRGFQTLEGNYAYGYMRYIDKDSGELGRVQREERFMKAFAEQGRKNLRVMNGILAYSGWHLADTNMTQREAAMLAYDLTGYPPENVHFMILPGESKTEGHELLWEVNPIGIQKIVGFTIGENQDH